MEIKILGGGCANCRRLKDNTAEALKALGIVAEVQEVKDFQDIMSYGVMSTPALVVNGAVKSSGRVPSVEEIKQMLF